MKLGHWSPFFRRRLTQATNAVLTVSEKISVAKIQHMQLQLMHEAVQFVPELDGRAIKDILTDVLVDEDGKV